MATIKVFDSEGVKELKCFDTLESLPYLEDPSLEEDQDLESEE